MKVSTLHQPWASLVALGVKTIETRSWSTKYRGPLAIHAGRKVVYGALGDYRAETWFSDVQHVADRCYCDDGEVGPPCEKGATRTPCLTRVGVEPIMLPLGAIVATCTLVDVVPTDSVEWVERVLTGSVLWGRAQVGHTVVETDQRPYGDFTPGRYAWLLADVVPVDPPVPFKGGQGLTKTWDEMPATSAR